VVFVAGGGGGGARPGLWLEVVAHVDRGRDRRTYRFIQAGRYGRKVLAESADVGALVEAVTKYVARRIIERERALAEDERLVMQDPAYGRRGTGWRAARAFVYGLVLGVAAVIGTLYLLVHQFHY